MENNNTESVQNEPLLNIPPLTLWLGIVLAVCFTILQKEEWFGRFVPMLCFVPQQFTLTPFSSAYTLFSYTLLHFGWAHIGMNMAGLIAFGSGVERVLGKKIFCMIFLSGVLFGALGHWALFPHSENPLGGASAGISALFGGVLPLLIPRRRELLITSIVFIATNLVIGMMGMPGDPGLAIAWQAHIVGFLFGMIFVFLFTKRSSEN